MSTIAQDARSAITYVASTAVKADRSERTSLSIAPPPSTAWDAYDVWRRFIKEPRDARAHAQRSEHR